MPPENKTSQAVHDLFSNETNAEQISTHQYSEKLGWAIHEKYKRMEEALELIASEGSLDADAELARKKLKAKDALLFDPLS